MAELLRSVGAEELRARLGTPIEGTDPMPTTVTPARQQLRERVAFLSSFDPASLRLRRTKANAQLLAAFIAEDCEPVNTIDEPRWRLSPDIRRSTIAVAASPGLKKLLTLSRATNSGDPDQLLEAAARIARGAAINVTKLSLPQLRALAVVSPWFPVGVTVPDLDSLLNRIAELELREPLRMLIANGFVGRRRELKQLREHLLTSRDERPLAIFGPGGVGKSSLLAKAALSATQGPQPCVLTYLTFDRPELRADQPLSLLAEAARQLSASMSGELSELARGVERQARDSNRRTAAAYSSQTRVATSIKTTRRHSRKDFDKLAGRYTDIITRGLPTGRVLWILDTFEIAQRVGKSAVDNIFHIIDTMRRRLGERFRVVFAGRGTIDDDRVQLMELTGLSASTARVLLSREVAGLAVDNEFLDAVLDEIGTNPLSIRLAGELLRGEGRAGLRSAPARRRLLFRVSQEEIQGVLYRRILDHLDDDDVRKIANPGLVVRRIDAAIIREVLAKPCGLGSVSAQRATEILETLSREAALVESAGPGVVVHRADVRALVLPMIEREDAPRAKRIRQAAARYHRKRYERAADLIDKTEELYHRLMLAQPAKTLSTAWDRDAAAALQPALEEFPPASQAYLAERLGWIVDPEIFRAAADDSWAEQAARLCRKLLDSGNPEGALTLARERRSERVRPLVGPLVVEALATLGRAQEALAEASTLIDWASSHGQWSTFVTVSIMAARIAEDSSQWLPALTLLQGAREIAGETGDSILHLAAGVAMLRVQRRAGRRLIDDGDAFRREVLAQGRALRNLDRRRNPTLVRDLAAEFGSEAPDFVAAATSLIGVDLDSEAGSELVGSLTSRDRQDFNDFSKSAEAPRDAGTAAWPTPSQSSNDDLNWLESGTSLQQSGRVHDYLDRLSGTTEHTDWTNALASAFRVESDESAFE